MKILLHEIKIFKSMSVLLVLNFKTALGNLNKTQTIPIHVVPLGIALIFKLARVIVWNKVSANNNSRS